MMRLQAVLILSLVLAGGVRAGAQPAAFESGMQSLMQGNYAEAYCQWRPLADQGYAEAQYHVGWLYANGNGLAVDLSRALEFWTAAAEQGHADAQFAVGLAYTTGDGVEKDRSMYQQARSACAPRPTLSSAGSMAGGPGRA